MIASNKSPLIIGHRGASAVAPENTLASFARAFRDGADGIELDVRLARDGVPVVIHDATLSRTRLRKGGGLKLHLDLPPADVDDIPLGEGIKLPEWFQHPNREYVTLGKL